MKKIVCIYFEGNDSKIAIFNKENDQLKMLKAESIDTSLAFAESKSASGEKSQPVKQEQKEAYEYDYSVEETTGFEQSYIKKLNDFLAGEDLSKIKFVPILAEPAVYFQKINGEKDLAKLNITPKGKIDSVVGLLQLSDASQLAVYPSGKSNYLQAIDSLAKMNSKRFLKIPTVKCAEVSLASYIIREYDLVPSQVSLILYVGKEYSKLIFLQGSHIMHVGSTIAVGKNSFNAHNVIVSKILLDIEQAGLNNLDNILICGEDESSELKYVLGEAYPTSKVINIKTDDLEIGEVDSFSNNAAFIIPAAVADEYYAEVDKKFKGINLLPNYIKEEQKFIHLGWQSYLMFVLIFVSAFYFTFKAYSNRGKLQHKDSEITRLTNIEQQNREKVNTLKMYESKIRNVDNTKAILQRLSKGTGLLSETISKLSRFADNKRNLWLGKIAYNKQKDLKILGYTLDRIPVRILSDTYNKSVLQNIVFEPMRKYRVYKFSIDAGKLIRESKKNESKK